MPTTTATTATTAKNTKNTVNTADTDVSGAYVVRMMHCLHVHICCITYACMYTMHLLMHLFPPGA